MNIFKLSEAANLAVHATAFIATHGQSDTPISAVEIAATIGCSRDHLNKVLQRLNRVGLVSSRRGPKGGFVLARDPHGLTLLELIELFDGPVQAPHCLLGRTLCASGCPLHNVACSVNDVVRRALESTPVSELPAVPRKLAAS